MADHLAPIRRPPWLAMLHAFGQVLLALPTGLLLIAWYLAVGFSLLGFGLPLVRLLERPVTWMTGPHRALAGSFLGEPVPVVALPRTPGLGPVRQVLDWVQRPAFWRLTGWLLYAVTGGLVLSVLVVALPGFGIAMTALGGVALGPGTVPGPFVLWWIGAVALFALWWWGGDTLLRTRCRLDARILAPDRSAALAERVEELTSSRAASLDHSAAELRRIERDLHDGAQARLVALSMNLGLVEELMDKDPELARSLIAEARGSTGAALGDLRTVVRGIHPPVLADRGLDGAVRALALDMAIPVEVSGTLPGRPPAPVESAVYFAVAECLANTGKHSGARAGWIELGASAPDERRALVVVVGDDGRGGADPAQGTGMRGVMRRLSAFDGTMRVSSPAGGPTLITLEVPCDWSSPRITPSSGTA